MESNPLQPTAEQPMSVQDWLITLIIMLVPIVNFIMLFVWGFGSGIHKSKANWAKASLLLMLIGLVFWTIVSLIFGVALFSSLGGLDPSR
jgi:hypothetical protein